MLLTQSPILFAAWGVWCFAHSLPANVSVKRYLSRLFNLSPQRYRLIYVLFSSITLAPLLVWQLRVSTTPASVSFPWQVCRIGLFTYSAALFYLGGKSYNLSEFLGLSAAGEANDSSPMPFRRDGILAWVRHPWYSGGIALLIGLGKTPADRWDVRLLISAYLIFGCLVEERRLLVELGAIYRKYQQEVPMLLPLLRKSD